MNKVELAYFITPHGFGHASRACAVMQAIQRSRPEIHFHIYTSVPDWFFYESLNETFTLHSMITDVGLIQTSPFEIDFPATLVQLTQFYSGYTQFVESIRKEFRGMNIKAVLTDVAALGISVANLAKLPVFLVENFTWDWIYDAYLPEYPAFKPYADAVRETIFSATQHYLTEPFCQYPRSVNRIAKPITRTPTQAPAVTRKQLGIASTEKVVLLSMGGIPDQIQINVSSLEKKGVTFIVPGIGSELNREKNTIFLPHHSDFYHPNLVTASDAVIAKVGYSTIAEVYHARIPMGYIPRPDFPESKFLAAYLKDKMGGTEIKLNEFLSGKWSEKIDVLLESPITHSATVNGADQISEWILAAL